MNLNRVFIGGRMTRDCEVRFNPKGTAIGKFGIAINRKWKDEVGGMKEEVTFVDCTAFGRTAENIAQHFKKGQEIFLEARLKTESWDDKTTGQKRSKLVVVADSFQFVGGKSDAPAGEIKAVAAPKAAEASDDPDKDLPF
jgi:single-strand DNA-binding protein